MAKYCAAMVAERALARLLFLVSEYPCLRWSALALVLWLDVASFQLQQRHDEAPSVATSTSPVTWVVLAGLSWLHLAWCVNYYVLALSRVQHLGHHQFRVGADFRFESREIQEAYERWRMRGVLWSALDWMGVVLNSSVHLKTALTPGCGSLQQLWLLVPTVLHLYRIRNRRKLSPAAYSALSLTFCAYIWGSQVTMILCGDYVCVGGIAQEMLTGSVATAMLIAWLGYFVVSLPACVAQAYVPLKMVINMLGCTALCYTHVLLDEERLGFRAEHEWNYLMWLVFAVSLAAMSEFMLSLEQSESGMTRFLGGLHQHATSAVRS